MSAASAAPRVAAEVRFRRTALDILHDTRRGVRAGTLLGVDLIDAIEQAVSSYASFEAIPTPLLAIRGKVALLKRLLVPVRSKVSRVYVGPGRAQGEISVWRVRHPSRQLIERE